MRESPGTMKRDCDSQDRIEFREEANRGARTFLLVVFALFGTLCFLGFFDRLSRSGPEAWVYAGIGLAWFGFVFRLWRFFSRPRMVLTASALIVNGIFGQRVFRYANVVKWSGYVEKFYPKTDRGTSSTPVFIHRLLVRDLSGRERRLVLPGFGFNKAFVEALEAKSGIPVECLPDRET